MMDPAMTPAAWMIWSRAACSATVKLARSGLSMDWLAVASAMARRSVW
jgi:hypothetical protein